MDFKWAKNIRRVLHLNVYDKWLKNCRQTSFSTNVWPQAGPKNVRGGESCKDKNIQRFEVIFRYILFLFFVFYKK